MRLLSPVLCLRRFLLAATAAAALRADVPVTFSTSDPGGPKRVANWGLDTNWASADNLRRGLSFMGTANVTVIRLPAMVDQPTDNGLTADQQAHLQDCLTIAGMATAVTKWDLCAPGSDTVGAWYQTGPGTVSVDRWVQALNLAQQFYRRSFWMVEPFNEPDYATWGEGTTQNLADIMAALQAKPNFAGAAMAGGSTMSTDRATPWFDALNGRATIGTTHALYGTVANYVGFIQHVAAAPALPVNPEGHNLVEAILGADAGLNTLIWWGTAERARGEFVRASQGVRLGYGADWPNWTAAAVYRAPDGTIEAFLGSSERVGGTTTYTFHATDRDVYYDGHGPQRDYTVTIARNQERVITISVSPDTAAPIDGRYALVNASTGLCLEVAGPASGAPLQQNAYTGSDLQQWNVTSLATSNVGDLSYFLLTNGGSGLNADVPEWVFTEGAVIKQYNYPANAVEHWYFQPAGRGTYAIRSRWSNQCLAVNGTALGAEVVQRSYTGAPEQLWRLQDPATTPVAVPLQITTPPQSVTAAPGQTITFTTTAAGTGRLTYQWRLQGAPIPGATAARLVLPSVQPTDAGAYSVVVGDALGSLTSAAATLSVTATSDVGRLVNLSIRSRAGTGDQTLVAGLAIGGPAGPKPVLIRAIGPTLTAYGVNGALAAPELSLYRGDTLVQAAGAWGGAAALTRTFGAVGAFLLDPASLDAAIMPTLQAGTYTAQVTGAGGATGIALIELYDATPSGTFDVRTTPRLVNASARTEVGTGDDVLIAGFAIAGATARTVLIRATGPALAAFGVSGTLAAPRLDLIKDNVTLATNVGWAGDAQLTAAGDAVGAFELSNSTSRDSALLVTLPPGTYSAKVSGADGGTGIALVEVYEVP